jgi:hypothetical protein
LTTIPPRDVSLEMFPELTAELKEDGVDPEFQQSGVIKIALTDEVNDELKKPRLAG